jgi:hypothetical protein
MLQKDNAFFIVPGWRYGHFGTLLRPTDQLDHVTLRFQL